MGIGSGIRFLAAHAQKLVAGFAFFGTAVTLAGCTSKQSGVTLRLNLPNWKSEREAQAYTNSKVSALSVPAGATAVTQMTRIMITVSGPATPNPQTLIWDAQNVYGAVPLAQQLQFTVAKNAEALVQVLAITKDFYVNSSGQVVGKSDQELYYYGDISQLISSDSQDVAVTVNSTTFGTGEEGRIAGRWLPAGASSGPTGPLLVKYHPPSNPAHPMLIMTSGIHGGWFEVYSRKGAGFSYWLADGTELFPGSLQTTDQLPIVNSADTQRLVAMVPQGYRSDGSGSAQTGARYLIGGYFGPTDTSLKQICFQTSPGTVNGLFTDAALSNPMGWAGSAFPTTAFPAGILAGGTRTACSTDPATNFSNWITLDQNKFANNDGGELNFVGPFRSFTIGASQKMIDIAVSGTSATVKWNMLPGTVGNGRVNAVGVFTRSHASVPSNNGGDRDFQVDDQIACDRLTQLSPGFTEAAVVPVSAENTTLSFTINGFDAAAFADDRLDLIVCAKGASGYFRSGVARRAGDRQSMPATSLKLSYLDGRAAMTSASALQNASDTCTPVLVATTDDGGGTGYVQTAHSLTLTSSDTSARFYTEASCAGTPYTSLAVPSFWGQKLVYLQSASVTGTPYQIVAQDTSTPALNSGLLYMSAVASAPADRMSTLVNGSVKAFSCLPINYVLSSSSGTPSRATGTTGSVSVTLPTIAGLSFYQDADCLTAASDFSFTAGYSQSSMPLFFQYNGTLNSIDLSPSVVTSSTAATVAKAAASVTVSQPGATTGLSLSVPNQIPQFSCQPATVSLVDAKKNTTRNMTGAPITATLSATQGILFGSLSSCQSSTAPITAVAIAPNATKTQFYMRLSAVGSYNISAADAAAVLASTTLSNLTVVSAPASHLTVVWQGQTQDGAYNAVGTPAFQQEGTEIIATVYAVTDGNTLDTAFNKPSSQLNMVIPGNWMLGYEPTWSGGSAQFHFNPFSPSTYSAGAQVVFGGGSSGLNPIPSSLVRVMPRATQLKISAPANVPSGSCFPILMTSADVMTLMSRPTPAQALITMNSTSDISYFSDPLCTVSATSATIQAWDSATLLYAIGNVTNPALTISGTNGFILNNGSTTLNSSGPVALGSQTFIQTIGNTDVIADLCTALTVFRVDEYGHAIVDGGSALTINTTSLPPGGQLYSDNFCGSPLGPTFDIPAGQSARVFYFRSSVVSDGNLNLSGGTGNSSMLLHIHY